MNIYKYTSYKDYFNDWVKALPKAGRGEYRKLAKKLTISTTMISQVFKGDKDLSLELASELCDYLQLNDSESDYFMLLVSYSKAGSFNLKEKLKKKIQASQAFAKKLENRVVKDTELSEASKLTFYSSWVYSAVRMMSDLPDINSSYEIAQRLNLPHTFVKKFLDFLIDEGLVAKAGSKLKIGSKTTHLSADSPLVSKQHQNWRLRGFDKMALQDPGNLFYTGPMALSKDVADQVHLELNALLDKVYKLVVPSPSEVVRCLNIDWFEF